MTSGRNLPRFQGANFQKNLDLVSRVEEIAREKSCTPTQLVLAWPLPRRVTLSDPGDQASALP